jgi:hypothetical protein
MDSSKAIELATGPGGALVVLIGGLWALYVLATRYAFPLVSAVTNRHLRQFDTLLLQHNEANKSFIIALNEITTTNRAVQREVAEMRSELGDVSDKVSSLAMNLHYGKDKKDAA